MYLVGILLFLFLCVMVVVFTGGASLASLIYFLDLPSFLLVILLAWPILLSSGLGKSFCTAFSYVFNRRKKGNREEICRSLLAVKAAGIAVLLSGIMVTMIGLIMVMRSLDDPASIGPKVMVCLISMVYAVFMAMILLPVYYRLKQLLLLDEMEPEEK